MQKSSLILSPSDNGIIEAIPISRRNLLARGGALGAASTLGIGVSTALMPAVSHAYPTAPGDITLYIKTGSFLSAASVTRGGIIRKFWQFRCTNGRVLCLIMRFRGGSSAAWYYEGGIYGGLDNIQYYKTVESPAEVASGWKIVLRDGISQVPNSLLNTNIDSGRRLDSVDWPVPLGATILETSSLAEFSDADTVFWQKFMYEGRYAICMTVCHIGTDGYKVWSPIRMFEATNLSYTTITSRLNTLRNTAGVFAHAKTRLQVTQLAAATVAVGSMVGAAFFPFSIAAIGTAIVAAGAMVQAAGIYASNSAIAFSDATVSFNNGWETYCNCGQVVR